LSKGPPPVQEAPYMHNRPMSFFRDLNLSAATAGFVAPKAWAAWKTMATELVNPTSTATKPAVAAERFRSRKKDIGRLCMQGATCTGRGPLLNGLPPRDCPGRMGTT
jgi:hypothetical protein